MMHYKEIGHRLAAWHDSQQRDLPWRTFRAGQRDPYTVWVSEIMAQQTRLETVRDYYERWIAQFPTLEALAAADQQEVLKLWEGLGYYARARNLHRAAQLVTIHHGGKVPATRQELLALPGIGAYTAGAILSLAYNQRQPILDGNVKRVFSRLDNIDTPIDDRTTIQKLWHMAGELVEAAPDGAAGVVNEALMELGALLCTPANPQCLLCPLREVCQAAAAGTQSERPVMTPRKQTPHYDVTAGVIWQVTPFDSPLLIAQRPQNGMLGGLWEFPGGKLEAGDPDLAACLRREICEELGIEVKVAAPVTVVKHAYTHFRITLHAYHAHHTDGVPQALQCADWRWIDFKQVDAYPFPVTDQKIIAALRAEKDAGH